MSISFEKYTYIVEWDFYILYSKNILIYAWLINETTYERNIFKKFWHITIIVIRISFSTILDYYIIFFDWSYRCF